MWDERLDEEILQYSLGFSHLETKQTSNMNTPGLHKYILHCGMLGGFVFLSLYVGVCTFCTDKQQADCWCKGRGVAFVIHKLMMSRKKASKDYDERKMENVTPGESSFQPLQPV